jgi:hypothetical protein
MFLRLTYLLLAVLAFVFPSCHAEEELSQTTISVHSEGKVVAGIIFPIGVKVPISVVANNMQMTGSEGRLTGNVQGRFTPPAGQSIVFFGEQITLSKEPISAEHAKAVRDLEGMAGPDQLYRGRTSGSEITPEEWQRQNLIDASNMSRLAEIISAYGWPGLRFAGAASQTAFLVLQHADHASQKKYLPLLRDAVKRNDALGSNLALLEDRVRVHEGKPQLYGSQLSGSPLWFEPIEDEAHVDERRREVGLEPLGEYAKRFGLTYPAQK